MEEKRLQSLSFRISAKKGNMCADQVLDERVISEIRMQIHTCLCVCFAVLRAYGQRWHTKPKRSLPPITILLFRTHVGWLLGGQKLETNDKNKQNVWL